VLSSGLDGTSLKIDGLLDGLSALDSRDARDQASDSFFADLI